MKRSTPKEVILYRLNESLFQEDGDSDPMAWAQQLSFPIVGFRHAIVGPEWSTGNQVENDYLHHINLVVGGAARLRREGRVFDLTPGFAYWLPGNWPAQRECAQTYETYYLTFRCEWFSGVDLLLDWADRDFKVVGPWDPSVWTSDWTVPLSLNASMRLQSQLVRWIADAVPDLREIIRLHVVAHSRFAASLAFMEKELSAQLRMSNVAAVQGLSTHAFSMAFSRLFGVAPKTYLNRRLNEKVLQTLTESDVSMREIAERFGFNDEYYFNRFFKKMNGQSPSRFRQKVLAQR